MFFVMGVVFSLLFLVAFEGDYIERERKKDYEDYNRIVKGEKNEK